MQINRYQNIFFNTNYTGVKLSSEIYNDGDSDYNANIDTGTNWKYDEDGNIIYYTYDKKTGEIISKTKCKNPAKEINKINLKKFV